MVYNTDTLINIESPDEMLVDYIIYPIPHSLLLLTSLLMLINMNANIFV